MGGSYCVEALTTALERQATEYIGKIDRMGGVVRAIDAGYIQREIQDAAYRYQQEIERKERIVVGVNEFKVEEKSPGKLLSVDPRIEKSQRKRLSDLRRKRDGKAVRDALEKLETSCRGKDNVMPPILSAVRAYATIGEISDVMRGVFGTYRGKVTV